MGYDVDKKLKNNSSELNKKEIELIEKYRKLTGEQKIKLEGIIESYLMENQEKEKRDVS